jgi:hypothetical protein
LRSASGSFVSAILEHHGATRHVDSISQTVDARETRSNGIKGDGRKVDSANFTRWQLKRSKKPEREESDAKVARQIKKTNSN